eukprot:15338562-Ditylum_brightwellii.AAC.1
MRVKLLGPNWVDNRTMDGRLVVSSQCLPPYYFIRIFEVIKHDPETIKGLKVKTQPKLHLLVQERQSDMLYNHRVENQDLHFTKEY